MKGNIYKNYDCWIYYKKNKNPKKNDAETTCRFDWN